MSDNVVGVRFHRGGRIYNFDANNLSLNPGHEVIVETEHGLAFGIVRKVYAGSLLSDQPNPDFTLRPNWRHEETAVETEPTVNDPAIEAGDNDDDNSTETDLDASLAEKIPAVLQVEEALQLYPESNRSNPTVVLKKVLRLATDADREQLVQNRAMEKKALNYCRQRVAETKLNMNLVTAEHHFDRSKIIIFFTSEERLDFRELVYDLASHLHTKVELRQIGVRQETKMLGGLGGCGRELCCAHFLQEFSQVGVKMAKEQSLSLNPTKISGVCGRLMCCLSYEFETYRSLCKDFPKVGKKVKISPELEGKVLRHAPLSGQLTVLLNDGRTVTCTMQELYALEPAPNRRSNRPALPTPPPAPARPAMEKEPASDGEKPKRRSRRSRSRRKFKGAKPGQSGPEAAS